VQEHDPVALGCPCRATGDGPVYDETQRVEMASGRGGHEAIRSTPGGSAVDQHAAADTTASGFLMTNREPVERAGSQELLVVGQGLAG
jgi:hypothetical protein